MNKYLPEGRALWDSNKINGHYTKKVLEDMAEKGTIGQARVLLCDSGHNLHIELGCMRGVIHKEESVLGMKEGNVKDIAVISRVNKNVCFKVKGFEVDDLGVEYAVLSRSEAQEDCFENYLSTLVPGDIIEAKVTHLDFFGAFCDIGCGISSLLPIDGISVSRIPHPSARLFVGENIKVIVRSIDENGRITLSHKELLGTWLENANKFTVGETVPGIVRSIEDYGIFVELSPNLAGLAELVQNAQVGMYAGVYIKNIIPEKMKIKLIIVDCFSEKYPVSQPEYFYEGSHMDKFVYSPLCCQKKIESVF